MKTTVGTVFTLAMLVLGTGVVDADTVEPGHDPTAHHRGCFRDVFMPDVTRR